MAVYVSEWLNSTFVTKWLMRDITLVAVCTLPSFVLAVIPVMFSEKYDYKWALVFYIPLLLTFAFLLAFHAWVCC